jgi:LPS sulfotransferase NodH
VRVAQVSHGALVSGGFPAHWRETDAMATKGFDWQAAGVEIPYVILITGRCGSTHLASMLTGSGACGEPIEYFNELYLPGFPETARAQSLDEYIAYLVRSRSSNRRFGFKIDYWRWETLRSLVDVEALLPNGKAVFFLMTRKDIVAQAYSFATARATATWHDYADEAATSERGYEPSDAELLRELTLIVLAETGFAGYLKASGRSALRLTYEELLSDATGLLQRVGQALEVGPLRPARPVAARSSVRRLSYTLREERIGDFRTRFAREISLLERHRETFRYETFRKRVLRTRGIDVGAWPAAEREPGEQTAPHV